MNQRLAVLSDNYGDIAFLDQRYRHFEQLRDQALVWDLDFRQLGTGQEGHRLLQLAGRNFGFVYCVFQCPYDQRSISPPGLRTFSILAENRAPSSWCGTPFGWNTLVSMPVSDEFRALSSGYFSNYVFSLAEPLLEATAAWQFDVEWQDIAPDSRGASLEFPAESITPLRLLLAQLSRQAASAGQELDYLSLNAEIAALVVGGLVNSRPMSLRRGQINRQRYFRQAQDYVDAHVDGPLLIQDICRAVGVSERTLEYAFREQENLSPKAYLNSQRLARVRERLVQSQPGETTVARIANRYGLWHMGQFARDYRALYGENPGQTLQRAL